MATYFAFKSFQAIAEADSAKNKAGNSGGDKGLFPQRRRQVVKHHPKNP